MASQVAQRGGAPRQVERPTPLGEMARQGCVAILVVALSIIVSVGALGKIPLSTLGWCMTSMGAGSLVLTIASHDKKTTTYEKTITALGFLAITGVGIAGGLGGLTKARELAWGFLGSTLAGVTLVCPMKYAEKRARQNNPSF